MKITLESTTKIVELRTPDGIVPARIWEGTTSTGIPVHAYVTRIACDVDADATDFERELKECRKPSPAIEAIPGRLVL
jgi:hypothetical protein